MTTIKYIIDLFIEQVKKVIKPRARGSTKMKANVQFKTLAVMLNKDGELITEFSIRNIIVLLKLYDFTMDIQVTIATNKKINLI